MLDSMTNEEDNNGSNNSNNSQEPNNKKQKTSPSSNGRRLLDLRDHLLAQGDILSQRILSRLSAVDFFMFSGVCESWRLFAARERQYFLANQPPLIVLRPTPENDQESWYFYNIFDGRVFKTTLPSLVERVCNDISCGYLFMEDREVWEMTYRHVYPDSTELRLVNPLTRKELDLPCPQWTYSHVILSTPSTMPDLTIVAISRSPTRVQFCSYENKNWTVIDHSVLTEQRFNWIADIAVFKDRAYVLTDKAQIGILHLCPQPHVKILGGDQGNVGVSVRGSLYLAVSEEELLMVHLESEVFSAVYKLEKSSSSSSSTGMLTKWEKMESLGDRMLFLDALTGCHAFRFRTRTLAGNMINMDMVVSRNCIYYMNSTADKFFVYSLDDKIVKPLPCIPQVLNQNIFKGPHYWFFPHLAFEVDYVSFDDDI